MKYSVILGNLGNCCDRYLSGGYKDETYDIHKLLDRLGKLEGISGVELISDWHVTDENMPILKSELKRLNLPVVAIIPNHFGTSVWGRGAFTAPDEAVRALAVEETNRMARCARELNCPTISIWNGQDGYDYPLQANYPETHRQLLEGITACARSNPDIQISIEYKPKEPRTHCFVPNVYSAVMLSEKTGLNNVGVTIDVGHSFEAYENVAEAVCVAASAKRLFHFHINDNYRLWDDDMMTGSVHTIEYIEMFYWLKKAGYDGYISLDQYPYREESLAAAQESIRWMQVLEAAADRIDEDKMRAILNNQDAVASTRYLRELIFG